MAERCLAQLAHRGPDDHGLLWLRDDGFVRARELPHAGVCTESLLLFRRLAILDLSPAAAQPMVTADGRYAMVFNGEIYNYRELRAELVASGSAFHSSGDSEVLLEAFRKWNTGMLSKLTGMFACVVYDRLTGEATLMRDQFGIKPLFYHLKKDTCVFASELGALLTLVGAPLKGDPAQLYMYLRHGSTDVGGRTMYEGVFQLPAAHFARVNLRDGTPMEITRYWDVRRPVRDNMKFSAAVEETRELFLTSLRLHARSDVPIGVALSGGVDSSAVLGGLRHVLGPSQPINAFSYFADDPRVSEQYWIDLAASHAGASVFSVTPTAEELARDLDRLISHQGEPFGSTRIYAQYRVYQRARSAGVPVILDGQGADEMLAGYRPYLAARIVSLLREYKWHEAFALLLRAGKLPGSSVTYQMMWVADGMASPGVRAALRRAAGHGLMPRSLSRGWFRDRIDESATSLRSRTGSGALREQLIASLTETGLQHLLRYQDRNSMAHSVESRVPFLTTVMAEHLLSLPESFLIGPDGTTKRVFREAMRGIVAQPLLDRRDKLGFPTPERQWLETLDSWVHATLNDDAFRRLPMLDRAVIRHELPAIMRGSRPYHEIVWRWINLARWSELGDVTYD